MSIKMTLPLDSTERKNYPMLSGCLRYFPAAIAGVAKISKLGNDKHNPGQDMHHARGKSADHGDCILRHLTDTEDLLAALSRGEPVEASQVLLEASQLVWRALAYSQQLHENFGAPLAPGAILPQEVIKDNEPAKVFEHTKLNIGGKVQIRMLTKSEQNHFGVDNAIFMPQMVRELGRVGTIEYISDDYWCTVKTDALDTMYCWPSWALVKI